MMATSLQEKIKSVENTLNDRVLERHAENHALMLALATRTHICLIGSPGTAKSLQLRLVKDLFGLTPDEYWEYEFDPFMTPDQTEGPISLKKLTEDDEVVRITKHKLPQAKIANLQEAFKASSATLNTMLSLLNERVHYNPDPQAAPLSTAMASSNELPDDERLAALADRFLTWIEVKRLSQPRSFIQMLENAQTPQPIEQIMTWEQLVQAQVEVANVKVPVTLYEPLAMLREQLYRESIVPSDRRWVEAMKLVQAEAWMNGRSEAKLSDCRPLRHCLWSDPVQIPVVEKHVLEMASELDRVALELNEAAASLLEYLNSLTAEPDHEEAAWRSKVVEFGGKLRRHEAEMDELAERYRLEQETSPVFEGVERLTNYISDRANKEIFEGFTTKRRARKTGEGL